MKNFIQRAITGVIFVAVLIGCIIFAGVMTMLRWDFSKLSTVKYETNSHEISETFHAISIKTDTADIIFALSDDGRSSHFKDPSPAFRAETGAGTDG